MTTDIQLGFFSFEHRNQVGKAVALHLLVLFFAFMAPHVFQYRFKLPDSQTVTLYSVTEIAEQLPSQQKKVEQQPPVQEVKPEPVRQEKQEVSINTEPVPKPVPVVETPAKIISLKPIKRKKVINKPVTGPLGPSKAQLFRKQQATNELLAAQTEAELARKLALDRIRQNLRSRPTSVSAEPASVTRKPITAPLTTFEVQSNSTEVQGGVNVEEFFDLYNTEVKLLISQYWQVPELRNWDSDLLSSVVVVVNKNGEILKSYFEKRSSNKLYNQSLERAIKLVGKLPPLPAEIQEDVLEIGLRFRLGDML